MKTHVLLCSHNGEKYIQAQIQSIRQQQVPVDYLHIYDFSSTDNTLAMVREAMDGDARLILHTALPALGAETSFNVAIRDMSQYVGAHDCIFLADQDDVWKAEKTERMLATFQQHIAQEPLLVIAHDVHIVDASLSLLRDSFYTGDPYAVPRDLLPHRILLCNPLIGHTMAISGAMLQFIGQHIRPGQYLMHDWSISLMASRYGKILFIADPALSYYRQHAENLIGVGKKFNIFQKIQRTHIFSSGLIQQSIEFGKDIKKIDLVAKPQSPAFLILKKITSNYKNSWLIYPYLAYISLKTGPTLKRKMLAAFFTLAWIKSVFKK